MDKYDIISEGILKEGLGIGIFSNLHSLGLLVALLVVFFDFLYPSLLLFLFDILFELPLGESANLLECPDNAKSSGLLQAEFFCSHINMDSSS